MLTNVALIGGLAGYFASGGKGENVSATSGIARSGLQNNYLSHAEILAGDEYRRRCLEEADMSACNALDAQMELDYARDETLDACVGNYSDICQVARRELRLAVVDFFQKNTDGEQPLSLTGLSWMNRTVQISVAYFDPRDSGLATLSGPNNYGYATNRENELARIAEAFRVGDMAGMQDGSLAGFSATLMVVGVLTAGGASSRARSWIVTAAGNAEFRIVIPPRPTLWTTWENYPKVTRMVNNRPQEFAIIGGRYYSEHAVARMQPSGQRYSSGHASDLTHNPTSGPWARVEPGVNAFDGQRFVRGRSISPTYIEDIIRNTAPIQQGNNNWNYTSGNIQVILSPDKMRVISVLDVH